jgi:hypothetical protein
MLIRRWYDFWILAAFVILFTVSNIGLAEREYSAPPGENALMLGGAFCATSNDASGLFYNPAGLGLVKESRLSGSTQGYARNVSRYRVRGLGVYKTSSEGVVPGMLGGVSKPVWTEDWTVGFAIITLNHDALQQDDEFKNVDLASSLLTSYVNRRTMEVSATWLGIGGGKELLVPNTRIGWSVFSELRSDNEFSEERIVFTGENFAHAKFFQRSSRRTSSSRRLGAIFGAQHDLTSDISVGASLSLATVVRAEKHSLAYSHGDALPNAENSPGSDLSDTTDTGENVVVWGQAPWKLRTGFKWKMNTGGAIASDAVYSSRSRQAPIADDTRGVTNVSIGWQEAWLMDFATGLGLFTNLDQAAPVSKSSKTIDSKDFYGAALSGQVHLNDTKYTVSLVHQESRSHHKLTNENGIRPVQDGRATFQQIMVGISSGW